MTDKNAQRNVRSSSKEGLQTPTQKHYHSLSEEDNIAFGEKQQKKPDKKGLLEKFRRREKKRKEKKQESKKESTEK